MSEESYKFQFKFVLIRYVPNFVRGEFFNAGLILYDMTNQNIIGKVDRNPAKLKCYDSNNYRYFLRSANNLIGSLREASKQARSNNLSDELLEKAFVAKTTPTAGLISFSNVMSGITNNIETEFEGLYKKFVADEYAKGKDGTKLKRDIAVTKVYEILDRMKNKLRKQPTETVFDHPLIEMGYKFEVSFNEKDNLHLKVLSLRSTMNYAYELQNVISAITILSDLKKQHKGHTFGGLLYFSPKYNKRAQEDEFRKLKDRFEKDGLDCVRAEEKELEKYLGMKNLLK